MSTEATTTDQPEAATRSGGPPGVLAIAGAASIGAGVIHATATGAHGEHRQTAITFALLAVFQIGWGVLALSRSRRWLALLGAAGNAAALGGFVLAQTSGIGFVDGLEEVEPVQLADGLAAALAAVAVLAALVAAAGRLTWLQRPQPVMTGLAMLATVGLAVPAMVSTGEHRHAGGQAETAASGDHAHGEEASGGGDGEEASGGDHGASTVPPRPYDGTLPVDLGGVPGVSADEQAEAEALLTETIEGLPQWADTQTAIDAGYRSIGDAGTGHEHYIKWDLIGDDKQFDPDYPESLVYRVEGDQRILAAAMYMLNPGDTLETAPDIGGELIQFHIHDNLCFGGADGSLRVVDVAPPGTECERGRRVGQPVPMMHMWIEAHPCGPFAALEGIGAGQVAEGETRACDEAHGHGGEETAQGG
jgi:hypothetical protein